ncbi:MAG: DNA double-strand break repair nuclease NurA, partial [Chloroflexota bacterium]
MSLDLTRVVSQVGGMVAGLRDSRREMAERLRFALNVAGDSAIDLADLRRKIAASRTTWLVADLLDRIDRRHPEPPTPADFTVIAADGSHIEVDRHRAARCYLINIGSATIRYGSVPDAALESFPRLYSADEDLAIVPPPGATGREQVVEGPLLGIKRDVEECRQLAEAAASLPPGSTGLALLDGSLIKWSLEAYPDFVTEALLRQGFLRCLD